MIDVENLTGLPRPSCQDVSEVRRLYGRLVVVDELDHVVVACNHGAAVEVRWEAGPLTILLGPEGIRRDGLLRLIYAAAEFPCRLLGADPHWRRLAPEAVRASTVGCLVGEPAFTARWRDPACGQWGDSSFRLWRPGCEVQVPDSPQEQRGVWCLPGGSLPDLEDLEAPRGVLCVPLAESWSPRLLQYVQDVMRRPGWRVVASGRVIPPALRSGCTEVIVGSSGPVVVR